MAVWAADVRLKAPAPVGYAVTLQTQRADPVLGRSTSPMPGGSVHVPVQPWACPQPPRPIPVRSSSTPTRAIPRNMPPQGQHGRYIAPAQQVAVPCPVRPVRPVPQVPQVPQVPAAAPPVWHGPSACEVSVPAVAAVPVPAQKNPTLTILLRDFEMTANLPTDWGSDLGCCTSLAEHILQVVSELAQGLRVLVPLEPDGPSVPVPKTGREDPAWHQVYENHQDLLSHALQLSNADSVRSFFQQSSCGTPGLLSWRLGEVQGFLRLCFTAFGLPAPNCHPAVWYQLIREVADDPAINEEQSLQLLRLLLQRLLKPGSQPEKEAQLSSTRGSLVAKMSPKAPSPAPSTRTLGSADATPQVIEEAQLRHLGSALGVKSPYRVAWNESAPELRGSWSGSFGPASGFVDPSVPNPEAQAVQADAAELFTGRCMVEPEPQWGNISFGALADNAEMLAAASSTATRSEDGLSGTGLSTGRKAQEAKLPQEKEVCQLLEAVQTAFLDLAQRLGSQRAMWKGQQVPIGDMQWFDLNGPVDPQSAAVPHQGNYGT